MTEPPIQTAPQPSPHCPFCGATLQLGAGPNCLFCGVPFTALGAPSCVPWENRARLGLLNALFATVKQVLFNPAAFFSSMPVSGGISSPLFFYAILATVAGWLGLLFQFPLEFLKPRHDPREFLFTVILYASLAIGMPFLVLVGACITSGILHLCLMIVGGANRNFEATFRTVCYSGAAHVWAVIPFCGGAIAFVWILVCECIGLARVHQTTSGKAVLAVLLPLMLCAVCAFFAIALVFGLLFLGDGQIIHSLIQNFHPAR